MSTPPPIITDKDEKPQPPSVITDGVKAARPPGLRLALLAGVLMTLANPSFNLWPLAWIAIAPLIVSVTGARHLRQAMWRGYLFGWTFLGSVWYWVGLTIVAWMNGSPLGWAAWFGLTLILAGFYALWGGLAWWLARRVKAGTLIIALASAWVLIEWARTVGSLTMPWAQLSYSQVKFLPVLQIADITGAYGVSFLVVFVNGALAYWWLHRGQEQSARFLWSAATVVVMVCLYGWVRMLPADVGSPFPLAVMQSNFNSFKHIPPEQQQATISQMTLQAAQQSPSPVLIVWAESDAPGDAVHDFHTFQPLTALARQTNASVLIGSRVLNPLKLEARQERSGSAEGTNEANAAVLIPPYGARQHYEKRQLVPFGEFIPFRAWIPSAIAGTFQFFNDDVTPGDRAQTLQSRDAQGRNITLGPLICYEAMYPQYAREMSANGANILVGQTNASWFQVPAAMEELLAAIQLRAIENRRQTASCTTTGISCILDSRGRILAQLPTDRPENLNYTLRALSGKTVYTRFGDWFVLLCGLVIVGIRWKTRPGQLGQATVNEAEDA